MLRLKSGSLVVFMIVMFVFSANGAGWWQMNQNWRSSSYQDRRILMQIYWVDLFVKQIGALVPIFTSCNSPADCVGHNQQNRLFGNVVGPKQNQNTVLHGTQRWANDWRALKRMQWMPNNRITKHSHGDRSKCRSQSHHHTDHINVTVNVQQYNIKLHLTP